MSCDDPIRNAILEQVIHKVPGNSVQFKKEKQGYVNLSEKSKSDLIELLERQNKLIKNKVFIEKLPDKGEKIMKYRDQLDEELKKRDKSDDLSNMLLKLNINGKEALDKLEWTGNCNPGQCKFSGETDQNSDLNTDEFEHVDPLKIIANHSGAGFHKKITKILPPEESLIKPSDVEDLKKIGINNREASHNSHPPLSSINNIETDIEERYVKHLCDKFDNSKNVNKTERFLPHKTLLKTIDDLSHKSEKKCSKVKWEVTAATPPPPVFDSTKLISLEDSVKLQLHQAEKLKEVQMKHAAEKLKALCGQGIGNHSLVFHGKSAEIRKSGPQYESSSSDDDDDDDKESYHSCNEEEDDADERRGGITFYNLIDN